MHTVRRVERGHLSPTFERIKSNFPGTAPRSFFLVHGDDFQTLDLIADSDESFALWYEGLKHIIQDLNEARGKVNPDQYYLHSKFEEADIDGDGTLSKGEITLLLPQLHVHLPRDTINSIFSACDADDSGALDFKEFEEFVHTIRRRHDVEYLWDKMVDGEARFLMNEEEGVGNLLPFHITVLQNPTTSLIKQRKFRCTVSANEFMEFW